MSLLSVRASSSWYVQSTGDGARIILAHLFIVHKLENRDQLCGRARAARLTTLGGTSPRGVSPSRQAASQTQPKTPTAGIILISGNTRPFSPRFGALSGQSPSLTKATAGQLPGHSAHVSAFAGWGLAFGSGSPL